MCVIAHCIHTVRTIEDSCNCGSSIFNEYYFCMSNSESTSGNRINYLQYMQVATVTVAQGRIAAAANIHSTYSQGDVNVHSTQRIIRWAHLTPNTKRHLDRFSRLCRAHQCVQHRDRQTHTRRQTTEHR